MLQTFRTRTVHDRRAFSLIELLVAIGIIGLLVAIAIPQFIAYRARAVDSQMKSDIKNAVLSMEAYFSDKKVYPTSVSELVAIGFNQTDGINLTINVTSHLSFTVTATSPNGTQPSFNYDSTTGLIN